MFDWVHVWSLAGPLKDIQRLVPTPLLHCLEYVLRVVVLLDLPIRLCHLRHHLRTTTPRADETVGLHNQSISALHKLSETVSGLLICMLVVLTKVMA